MSLWSPAPKPNPEATKHGRITVTDGAGNLLRVEDPDTSGLAAPCRKHNERGCRPCFFTRPPIRKSPERAMSRIEGARR